MPAPPVAGTQPELDGYAAEADAVPHAVPLLAGATGYGAGVLVGSPIGTTVIVLMSVYVELESYTAGADVAAQAEAQE